ncbi:potassium transporter Kup [Defluviimonas sp. 20V17]|nr:potassium transporter Kup [Defluviimonas sp. 20V17]
MALGAVGVVYGDIGTSPIYALREALRPVAHQGLVPSAALGVCSLLIWVLVIIVTLKYVTFLLRADNRGEGGVLALYTLARVAFGRRVLALLALAIAGAALFFGDAIITPAISVLSAVEGMELIAPGLSDFVLPVTLGILVALFAVQSRGTEAISAAFGPITALWFVVLGVTGAQHVLADPSVLAALDPRHALSFLSHSGPRSFLVLGAVFLAVTGAEALYADLGHFGKAPIRLAWYGLVFPALALNYLGQTALVMGDPAALRNPFFLMVPGWALPFLVGLATCATVIAAQAVISGAYSMTRAAIQLGFLPRLSIRHTSGRHSGQIYIPALNWMLFVGVIWLVLAFRSSNALASAYGIAVTGTMIVTTALAVVLARRGWHRSLGLIAALALPLVALELAFLAANLLKLPDGGYVPVTLAVVLGVAMAAWWRGTQRLRARERSERVDLQQFIASVEDSGAARVPGTAFFLTGDPGAVPAPLLHNLRHNRVLHDQNVILTIETLRVPVARPEERAEYDPIDAHFSRLTLNFGFMETPNLGLALIQARRAGLKFDVMSSTFFLGRRKLVAGKGRGLRRWLDRLYVGLGRFSADPSEFYHLPRNLVVELGTRTRI